jgi:hypothetical protein
LADGLKLLVMSSVRRLLRCSSQDPAGGDMKLSQIAEAVDAESWTLPAGNYTALKPQSADTLAHANGATHVISGTDWSDVATMEFPLFSGRLSILVS